MKRASRREQSDWHKQWDDYINSSHWADLRNAKFAKVGKKCHNCGSTHCVECHHIRYRNFTDCALSDLMVLCRQCHKTLHTLLKQLKLQIDHVDEENCKIFLTNGDEAVSRRQAKQLAKAERRRLAKLRRVQEMASPNSNHSGRLAHEMRVLVNKHTRKGQVTASGIRKLIVALDALIKPIEEEMLRAQSKALDPIGLLSIDTDEPARLPEPVPGLPRFINIG